MDLGEALRALLRRWLILLAGLLLTGGAAAWVYLETPVSYQSSGQVLVLLPPNANSPEVATNPFLYLPNGLNVLARVVAVSPTTPQFRRSMIESGFRSQYELTVETGGSMVTFSAEGTDPENVVATRDELMRRFSTELDQVQDEEGAPDRQRAHTRQLSMSDQATPMAGDRLRAVAMVGAAGVVLTLILTLVLDRWLLRRARRKHAARMAPDPAATDEPAPDPEDDRETGAPPHADADSDDTMPDDAAEADQSATEETADSATAPEDALVESEDEIDAEASGPEVTDEETADANGRPTKRRASVKTDA